MSEPTRQEENRTEMGAEDDVVDLLLEQHVRIRELFAAVHAAEMEHRHSEFEELRRFLVVHEAAEEMVVHPAARRNGVHSVAARLVEERHVKQLLRTLEGMKVDDDFDDEFLELERVFFAHAESEEREELALLRECAGPDELQRMAKAVRAAERLAPTRPHPGFQSATSNLVVAPVASVVDRTRDALGSALHRAS